MKIGKAFSHKPRQLLMTIAIYSILVSNLDMCHCHSSSSDEPKLITKAVHITSYEDQTVILPCQVLNLPAHMHIIWQHSKRVKNDHTRQVVLTIGKTLIESNYRVRVLSNGSTGHSIKNKISKLLEPQDMNLITTNNLEIRKLRIEDSGWYECQLPTKPTQKSYVFLQVHGVPRIQTNQQLYSPGDLVELTCHVHRLPKNSSQLYWTLNGKRVVAATVIDNYAFNNTFRRRRHRMVHQKHQKRSSDSHTTILNNNALNVTRLRISAADQANTGVYRCQYDKIETEYLLDFDRDDAQSRLKYAKSLQAADSAMTSVQYNYLVVLSLLSILIVNS